MPLTIRQSAPASADDVIRLPGKFPDVPQDIKTRFSTGEQWDTDIKTWWRTSLNAFSEFARSNSDAANLAAVNSADIILRMDGFTVALTEERTARITADEALGRWIVTVSALASSSQNISVQSTPPGGPSLNDLWVDNSDLTNPVTYFWNGAAWTQQTNFVVAAAVAEERTARVTADGFLEGKYTLTVTAGDVVTGMNITSASGSGTNISSVIFRATDFKIYNGVTGVTMFTVSGSNVNLANVLTVSTSGKVFTGVGNYANADTPFYVDGSLFSLGANLQWGAGTLYVSGQIVSTSGTIGGWSIGTSTLSGGNATLSSTGALTLGTGNDIVLISATDGTYRLWVGNTNPALAPFSVTKGGSVVVTSGAAGGWTISSTTIAANNAVLDSSGQLVLGTSNDVIILSATSATYRMWAGNASAGSASFSVTKAGALFSTSGTIGGFTIGSSSLAAGAGSSSILLSSAAPQLAFGQAGTTASTILDNGALRMLDTSLNGLVFISVSGGAGSAAFQNGASLTINLNGATGAVTATSFSGSGASLTSLSATSISSGTLGADRLGSGSALQVVRRNAGNTALEFATLSGGATWGSITGTLSAQTDLQSALDAKLAVTVLDGYFADPSTNASFSASAWRTDLALAASATTDTTDASNISSGTLNTARLPSTINIATAYQIGGTQVVTSQQAAIANAGTSNVLDGTYNQSQLETLFNAFGSKINEILAAARTHGLIAT